MLNYSMKLIFGLGNPDKKYQATRHNLGQVFIRQYLQSQHQLKLVTKKSLLAEICQIGQGSQKNIFAISTGYMNNSGQTAKKLIDFYKIKPENILVIHDDLDLPVGEWRFQFNRSSAGHNGIKSIIDHLQTQAFWRLRIGIGKPENLNISTEDYVLQPLLPPQSDIIKSLIQPIINQIDNFINQGL